MNARRLTLLAASSLTVMAGATIAPALPAIQAHFADVPRAPLLTRLVLTVPALAIAVAAPFAGVFADRFGRRRLLAAAIALYVLAGSSGLVAQGFGALLAGRALLGLAVAGIMTAATALAADYFAGAARNRFMGQQSAFMGLGGLFFVTGGGLLAGWSWRAPFAVYAVALALLPSVLRHLRDAEPAAATGRPGAPADEPTPRLALVGLFGVALLTMLAFYLVPTQLPFLLKAMGVEAPGFAGLAIGVGTIVSAGVALQTSRVRAHLSPPATFALGFLVLSGSYAMVAAAGHYAAVLVAMAFTGLGMGLIQPTLTVTAMAIAPSRSRGRVAGAMTTAIFLGQFLSPFASQPAAARWGLPSVYGGAAALLAATGLASIAVAWARRQGRAASDGMGVKGG